MNIQNKINELLSQMQNGYSYYSKESLIVRDNKEIAFALLSKRGNLIEYCSDRLKNDKE